MAIMYLLLNNLRVYFESQFYILIDLMTYVYTVTSVI